MTGVIPSDRPLSASRLAIQRGGFALLLSLLLGACGWVSGPNQAGPVTTGLEVPEEAWHPIVAEMIADGEVTSAELAVAYETYIECMEAAGMVGKYTYDVEVIGTGVPKVYNIPGDGPGGELTDRVEKGCYARIVAPVEGLYTDPLTWPEREAVQRESTIDCLAEVDPLSSIPDSVSLNSYDSPIYDEALRSGGNDAPIVQCIETLGVGWSEFQPPE